MHFSELSFELGNTSRLFRVLGNEAILLRLQDGDLHVECVVGGFKV